MVSKLKALIFDCDGVLADTERDGHCIAFNRTFAAKGYDFEWDEVLYQELVKIGGGKERMKHFFDRTSWPAGTGDKEALIKELHKLKTDYYTQIIESGELPLRPGVARLVDEAIAAGVKLAVCSTSNEKAVHTVVERLLGPERKAKFDVILAGLLFRAPVPQAGDLLAAQPDRQAKVDERPNHDQQSEQRQALSKRGRIVGRHEHSVHQRLVQIGRY